MKYIPVALAVFLVAAALLVFIPVRAETAAPFTWHIQDTAGNPINQATVDVENHSAQMTGTDGDATFNFFSDNFPITLNVTADGYNASGPLTFDGPGLEYWADPITSPLNYHIVTLTGDGPIIGKHAGTLCGGAAAICAGLLCCCFIVSRKTQ